MRFHHYGLEVPNLEESVVFYKKHFRLQEESRVSFMEEDIVFLAAREFRLELISSQSAEKNAHLCFEVDDLYELMKRFEHIQKIEGPYKLENGWETIFYTGPNKEVIEFLQVKPA
ncbi:VOC family protein [Bacillaceae bacterium C204]|uniref:VOC family protein n=1 Tax=Neobacillus sp. 204 TaxID=3383351 RepID=UPI00397A8CB7